MAESSCDGDAPDERNRQASVLYIDVFPGRSVVALRCAASSRSCQEDEADHLRFLRSIPEMLASLSPVLKKAAAFATVAVISDCNVPAAIIEAVCASFEGSGTFVGLKLLPSGESTKTAAFKSDVEEWMLKRGVGKDGLVVAIGGGVTGDLVGYVASTFLRGIPVIHVATTLMAMVDSSVGGKTAINACESQKNMFGTIYQPLLVVMDPQAALASLPPRVLREAFAEVVKYDLLLASNGSVASDMRRVMSSLTSTSNAAESSFPSPAVSFLLELASSCPCLSTSDDDGNDPAHRGVATGDRYWLHSRFHDWVSLIEYCVAAKAAFVRQDERETSGFRELLNLGHTVGHAVEAASAHTSSPLLHGEAVAIGLVSELELSSSAFRSCDYFSVWRLQHVLTTLGLPIKIPSELAGNRRRGGSSRRIDGEEEMLIALMTKDKKNRMGEIHCSLIRDIGLPFATSSVPVPLEQLEHCVRNTYCYYSVDPASSAAGAHQEEDEKGGSRVPPELNIPGSKSDANRAVMCAVARLVCQLADGTEQEETTIVIENALVADDCLLLIHAMQRLLSRMAITLTVDSKKESITVARRNASSAANSADSSSATAAATSSISVFVGNSGTSGRFLAAFVAAVPPSVLGTARVVIHGTNQFHQRPVADLVDAIRSAASSSSCCVSYLAQDGCFPISIEVGCLQGCNELTVSSSVSSQFLSALLLVTPVLLASWKKQVGDEKDEGDRHVRSVSVLCDMSRAVSRPFIDMTLKVMKTFGWALRASLPPAAGGKETQWTAYVLDQQAASDQLTGTRTRYSSEPDFTSASYFLALRALLQHFNQPESSTFSINADTFLLPLLSAGSSNTSSASSLLQPDALFFSKVVLSIFPTASLLASGGCQKKKEEGGEEDIVVVVGGRPLSLVNMSDLTDCFITAAVVLMPFAEGVSTICGIANQRVKECNRIQAVVNGLRQVGIDSSETKDGLTVTGSPQRLLMTSSSSTQRRRVVVACHADHRLAMAFSTLGLFLAANNSHIEIEIDDRRCVEKTFPTFFHELDKVREVLSNSRGRRTLIGRAVPSCFSPLLPRDKKGANQTEAKDVCGANADRSCDLVQIVLIGMRYCGKTTLGHKLAHYLGCEFIDIDRVVCENAASAAASTAFHNDPIAGFSSLPKSSNWTCGSIIEQFGWSGFRERECQALVSTLGSPPSPSTLPSSPRGGGGHSSSSHRSSGSTRLSLPVDRRVTRVIACGGGFVDYSPSFQALLRHHDFTHRVGGRGAQEELPTSIIVFLDRDVDELVKASSCGARNAPPELHRPAYANGESFECVHGRRYPYFRQLAHVVVSIPSGMDEAMALDRLRAAVSATQLTRINLQYLCRVSKLIQSQDRQVVLDESTATNNRTIPFTHFLTIADPLAHVEAASFSSSSCSSPSSAVDVVDDAAFGVDMIELRLDTMITASVGMEAGEQQTDPSSALISKLVKCAEGYSFQAVRGRLPLLITYRTASEGGEGSSALFTNDDDDPKAMQGEEDANAFGKVEIRRSNALRRLEVYLASMARVPGVGFIDLELAWIVGTSKTVDLLDDGYFLRVASLIHSSVPPAVNIILSFHATLSTVSSFFEDHAALMAWYQAKISRLRDVVNVLRSQGAGSRMKCSSAAVRMIVPKVVIPADKSALSCLKLHQWMSNAFPDGLYIAVCTGAGGKLSRAVNPFLTPVTHERLGRPGAVGQLSLRQLSQLRCELGLQRPHELANHPLRFLVAGSPISASRSPVIHNYIFQHLLGFAASNRLYDRLETINAAEVIGVLRSQGMCGGASVTIPLKESLSDKCDGRSPDVEIIGALNTIVCTTAADTGFFENSNARGEGRRVELLGFNTDWIGLFERLQVHRSPTDRHVPSIVVGAGGTARAAIFALAMLRPAAPIFVVNRSLARAVALADEFNSVWVRWRSELGHGPAVHVGWPVSTAGTLDIFAMIGTTPPGATELPKYAEHLPRLSPAVVVDFAYTSSLPSEFSKLVQDAVGTSSASAPCCVSGLDVLVSQAMHQDRLWWSFGLSEWPATIPYFPLRPDIEKIASA